MAMSTFFLRWTILLVLIVLLSYNAFIRESCPTLDPYPSHGEKIYLKWSESPSILTASTSEHKNVATLFQSLVSSNNNNIAEPTDLQKKLSAYRDRIYRVPSSEENCTMVIMTYRREQLLARVIRHYCNMKPFPKILIIWNDIKKAIPSKLKEWDGCTAKVQFIRSKENKMSNRFIPRDEIETECVCYNDDDKLVEEEDVSFAFQVWKDLRHKQVGFEERTFTPGKNNIYHYGVQPKFDVSGSSIESLSHHYGIMLMSSTFIHKAYLEMFFDPDVIPKKVVEYIDSVTNCDDILLSLVVNMFLRNIGHVQAGVMKVKSKSYVKLIERSGGLSSRNNHIDVRTKCLTEFAKIFGQQPPIKRTRLLVVEA